MPNGIRAVKFASIPVRDQDRALAVYTEQLGCRVVTDSSFDADDVDATARELAARGVAFVQPPKKTDWGTAAVVRDPDGNRFVLSTP
ncbi:hypothetical protein tb265_40790 [Gemmatimonadetes bacterium T265]|nr:hypothetical protein tb265_40790 [Gemmatimonadetes bacterium T265]